MKQSVLGLSRVKRASPTLVFALFAACSVVAYRASSPGYLLPAVLVALAAHLANKVHRALRPLSELELLPPDLPCTVAHVETWLRARDEDEAPLEPGAESCVTWAVEAAKPTELCVVYLHGWGASPPELSPVPEQLAAALGANLLRYRYTAHGLHGDERAGDALLNQQSATVLRQDAATAHALGLLLGRRVLLLGCSTGGSLALWLANQPWVDGLVGLVLVSPGLRLAMPSLLWEALGWLALLLPRAAAHCLLRIAYGGPYKKPKPRRADVLGAERAEMYARYWTTTYPIGASLHPISLFRILGSTLNYERLGLPVLALANPADRVNAFTATAAAVARLPRGELEVVLDSENTHVIAGDIFAPGSNERMVRRTLEFATRAAGVSHFP